jgi:hypothetical protein
LYLNLEKILKRFMLTHKRLTALILIVVFVLCMAEAQDTIYINPQVKKSGHGDGSRKHPFATWAAIKFTPGTTYLQMRGTTDTVDHIFLSASNIRLDGYGKGGKPAIFCITKEKKDGVYCWKQSNIQICNLEIIAPRATSCIYFNHNNTNNTIDGCIIHESQWGIRITSGENRGHKLLNTEVYNIADDGVFIQDAIDIEIGHCYIHDVNRKWKAPKTDEKFAPGDGIQFSRCNNWYVHHNTIDRRNSGNKFCFISNNPEQTKGVVEYNTFYCPRINGSCIYFGSGQGMIVRYNVFYGNPRATAIYHHSANLIIGYNLFVNFKTGIVSLNDSVCTVLNNTFTDIGIGIKGRNILSRNNIFDIRDKLQVPYYKVSKLSESYNHYNTGKSGEHSTSGDPCFRKPKENDFALRKESPCVNSGISTGYATDLMGNTVPGGAKTDKGAIESY